MVLFNTALAHANLQTQGTIQSLPKLLGYSFQYDSIYDVAEFSKPDGSKISVSVLPAFKPAHSLEQVLSRMNAGHYRSEIKTTTIASHSVATVSASLQTQHWWLVVERNDLNLFVRVESRTNPKQLRPSVEKIINSIQISKAVYPQNVSGNYNTGSRYSGSYDSSFSVYSESGITLKPDGSISASSYTGISGSNTSALNQSNNSNGWWQVRGNRLLGFKPPDGFHNFRFDAFSNGLEIHTGPNQKVLWARQ